MERKLLTTIAIEALKPRDSRYLIGDKLAPALILQVGTSGAKTWLWRGRLSGKVKVLTLGRYPVHTLEAARKWAGEISTAQSAGIDAPAEKAKAEAKAALLAARTVDWMFEEYMRADGDALRSARNIRQRYVADVKPTLGGRSIYTITHDDLHSILAAKVVLHPVGSNQVQKFLSRFFSWATREGRATTGLTDNAARDLIKLGKETKRERYLSDAEISFVLEAIPTFDSPLAKVINLLLLTGARRNEVLGLRWSEIDTKMGDWLLPADRSKNGREHIIPLPEAALAILEGIKRHETSDLVLWSARTPENHFSGLDKVTDRFRRLVGEIAAKAGKAMDHWTIHDLRRTVASGMSGLRDSSHRPLVMPVVVEACLNHVTGVRSGVAGVYNRHDYYFEKREALRLWAGHLDGLTKPRLSLVA